MATGAIVGVTVQGADQGDTTTIAETVTVAAEALEAVAAAPDGHTAWEPTRRPERPRDEP